MRSVTCPDNMCDIQAQQGEIAIEGCFSGETHYLDAQRMVAVEKPAKPAGDFRFDLSVKSWVLIQHTTEELDAIARGKRAQMLAYSDWTQLPDVPLVTKEAWASYRQALRDITAQLGFPRDIIWPVPPA